MLREAGGAFEAVHTISTLPDDFKGQNLGAEIKITPSGRFVYTSNRGHDSLAIYAVNQETGQLTLVGHEIDAGCWTPRFHHRSIRRAAAGGKPGYGHSGHILDQSRFRNAAATGHVANVPTPVCLQLYDAGNKSENG